MNKAINIVLRVVLGGVLVFAGALKIFDPATFAADVARYQILPHEWINLVAILLPWLEVSSGLCLILGVWVRASALVSLGMTFVFLVVVSQALARGLKIDCGCFGTVGSRQLGPISLAEDAVMFLMALRLTWSARE